MLIVSKRSDGIDAYVEPMGEAEYIETESGTVQLVFNFWHPATYNVARSFDGSHYGMQSVQRSRFFKGAIPIGRWCRYRLVINPD